MHAQNLLYVHAAALSSGLQTELRVAAATGRKGKRHDFLAVTDLSYKTLERKHETLHQSDDLLPITGLEMRCFRLSET